MTSMTPNYNTASDLGIEGVVPHSTHTNTQITKYTHACYDTVCGSRRACDHGSANKVNHLGADR